MPQEAICDVYASCQPHGDWLARRPDPCGILAHLFRGTDSASAALPYALIRRSSFSAPASVRALTGMISSRGMLGKNLMACTGQK